LKGFDGASPKEGVGVVGCAVGKAVGNIMGVMVVGL
jgi:hypothetical protein